MPRMPRPVRPNAFLNRLYRLAALIAWVGQLAVLGAPLVEARAGSNAAPHVESHSNPLHHAHTPELCPACTALALVGRPEAVRSPLAAATIAHEPPHDACRLDGRGAYSPATRPRAPPVWEL